jgi:hypothetical protein
MRYALLFAALITVNGPALGQSQPSLTWRGDVTGGATLYIQGNRVDVQGRDTGSVDRPAYRFRDMLPAIGQTVEVRVVRGQGRVDVVEQPTAANQYTAIVDIRNSGARDRYELEFFWKDDNAMLSDGRGARRREGVSGTRGRGSNRIANEGAGEVTWSGDVDHEVFITFRGRQAFTTAVRGRNVSNQQADFSSTVPRQNISVNLVDARGRGRVELIEQPTSNNSFSAKVRIVDEESGAGQYSFTLAWNGDGMSTSSGSAYNGTSGILSPNDSNVPTSGINSYGTAGSGIRWAGRVDGKIRVNVRGGRVWSQRLSGGETYDERAAIGAPLPERNISDVDVRKAAGRGEIEVIQRPSRSNNYTLVFEVEDRDAGADVYEVEINWRS